jgi:hypothetical protein
MKRPIKGKPELTADELDHLDSQAGRCFKALMLGKSVTRDDLASLKIAPAGADVSAIICKVERRFCVPVSRARVSDGPRLKYWIEERERQRYEDPKQRERQRQEVLNALSKRRQNWCLSAVDHLASDYVRRPAMDADRIRQAGERLIEASMLNLPATGGPPDADRPKPTSTYTTKESGHARHTQE